MKKLRLFDSLKFVRFVVAVVAATFILNVAHADNTWKYAPLPIGYVVNSDLVELTESNESFNTYTVKETKNTARRMLYITNANPLPANHKYFMRVRFNSNFTSLPYFRYALDGTYTNIEGNSCRNNEWCNVAQIITPQQELNLNGASDGLLVGSNSYIAGETITIDKNGFLTVFDLTEIFGAGNEPATVADAERALSIDTTIKIATTRYNEEQFEPVQNRLSDAMDAVDDVVTRTMTQAQAIDQIATNKQTRPDEGCDAKYCLLVEDEDGTPHWYPIAGANGVAHNLPAGYTELQYTYMTSGSYLLTDIVPTYDGKVVFEFTTTTPPVSGAYFLGGRTATYGGLFFGKSSGGVFIVDAFGSAPNNRYTSSVIPADNTRYKFTFDNKVATLESGGSTLFTETFTGANANGANLAINTLNNNGTTMGYSDGIYVHSLKVWNAQGELVANYIPAKQTNPLTVGFYDTVSKTFKTATAGTFTAGPDM